MFHLIQANEVPELGKEVVTDCGKFMFFTQPQKVQLTSELVCKDCVQALNKTYVSGILVYAFEGKNLFPIDQSTTESGVHEMVQLLQNYQRGKLAIEDFVKLLASYQKSMALSVDAFGVDLDFRTLKTLNILLGVSLKGAKKVGKGITAELIIGLSSVIALYLQPKALESMSGNKRFQHIQNLRNAGLDLTLSAAIQGLSDESIINDDLVKVLQGLSGGYIETSQMIERSTLSEAEKIIANHELYSMRVLLLSALGCEETILFYENSILSSGAKETVTTLFETYSNMMVNLDKTTGTKIASSYWQSLPKEHVYALGVPFACRNILQGSTEVVKHLKLIADRIKEQVDKNQEEAAKSKLARYAKILEEATSLHLKFMADLESRESERIKYMCNLIATLNFVPEEVNLFLSAIHPMLNVDVINNFEPKLQQLSEQFPQLAQYWNLRSILAYSGPVPKLTSGGGCFIATAAYDSIHTPELELLRQFRNEILLKSKLGRTFVTIYYRLSPPIATTIAKSQILKRFVRYTFLRPLIKLVRRRL